MKTFIFMFMGLFSIFSHAELIAVNQSDKVLYYHPKPNLEMNLQDLGSEGGILYLSVTYTAENAKRESADLSLQYPGYKLSALVAQASGIASFQLGNVLTVELPMQQQQLGPYINTTLQLTADQTRRLVALGDRIKGQARMRLPVSFSYRETYLVERYVADSSLCANIHAQNLREAIQGLMRLPKPRDMRFETTLASLKESMLAQCFSMDRSEVQSFAELLQLRVKSNLVAENLVGVTTEQRSATKKLEIEPNILLSVLR